jgi:outer membrane receptor for ferrienterochelin and colicins
MGNDRRTQCRVAVIRRIALIVAAGLFFSGREVLAAAAGGPESTGGAQAAAESAAGTDLTDMSLEALLNVQITTASRQEERQSDAPGIVSVMTHDELMRFGGTTLKDILERVPGLIGSSVYMTDRSMIAIRGDQISNSGEHVLLLINGRPVREVQEGGIKSEVIETFPVDIIDRIEVVKGPGSVLYGSTAFSGVINVITERAEKTGMSITGLVGEAGAHGTLGHVKLRSGDFGLVAAGRNLEKPEWPVDYVAASPGGNLVNRLDNPNRGTAGYMDATYKDFSFMASMNQWETSYVIPDSIPVFGAAFGVSRWDKTFLNMGYDKQVAEGWRTTANVTSSRSQFDTSSWPHIERDSSETLVEWTNFVVLSERSKLTLGGLADWIQGTESDPRSGAVWSEGSRFDYSFYTQIDYQLQGNVKVIGGAQANKIENLDWDLVPRGGIIWYPTPCVNVKALYGEAFRAPSINETHLNHPALRGSLDVEPERVGTIDLAVGYQGERAQVQVDYFRSRLTHIIYQDRTGFPTYANGADTITIQGAEVEGKYYVNKAVFLTGSVLYQTSEDGSGRKNLTPIAELGTKAGISYASANGLTVGLFDIYQGPLDKQYDSSLNPSPGEYNKLSLYCRLNLRKFFQWKEGPDASLILQADNLLGREIWLPNWGLLPGQSIPYDQGRVVYVGLNLTF